MSERAFGEEASSLSVVFDSTLNADKRQVNECVHIAICRCTPGLAIM